MLKAKKISGLLLPVIIAGMALVSGCENDLKDLKKISAAEVDKPIERYTGVDVIYSDSAKVKAHLTSPLLYIYKVAKPYKEMPKGLAVTFYDANLKPSGTITADYGIQYDTQKIIVLRKNVVATNVKGETFTSNELIWDQNTKQIHSDQTVHVKMADGSVTEGTSFISDQNLEHWTLNQATGIIHVDDQDTLKK